MRWMNGTYQVIDGIPVIDAVVHAFDFSPDNYVRDLGGWIAEAAYQGAAVYGDADIVPSRRRYFRDWSIEEVGNMVFLEGMVDIAVHHALPLWSAYKDGGCSFEKTLEAKQRWPYRWIVYGGLDPLTGSAAIDELERQVAELHPAGLKLYPNGWVGDEMRAWSMDDPEVAFPVFQRAQELGVKVIAIHKAVPLGPVPLAPYRVDDIDRAAIAFPDLCFEIVHGGMAFLEETAFQLARFKNVYVNLETTSALVLRRPQLFARAMQVFLAYGGAQAIDRILWGTGAMSYHPAQFLRAFVRDFRFSDELMAGTGIPQLDLPAKRKILAENYAAMVGLDLSERLDAVRSDGYSERLSANGGRPFPAYSTTKAAAHAA
jgi:uncharacterized protein